MAWIDQISDKTATYYSPRAGSRDAGGETGAFPGDLEGLGNQDWGCRNARDRDEHHSIFDIFTTCFSLAGDRVRIYLNAWRRARRLWFIGFYPNFTDG